MRAALRITGMAAVLLLAGCTGSTNEQAKPGAAATSPAAGSSSASSSAANSASASSSAASPTPAASASQNRSTVTGSKAVKGKDTEEVLLEIRGLHRDGKLLRLDYSVTNTSPARLYAGGLVPVPGPNDVFLLDTAGLKKYLVVKDSAGLLAFPGPDVALEPGRRFDGSGYFAAPPEDVRGLKVVYGKVDSFDTPIS